MKEYELDLVRYKRGGLMTLGIIIAIALSFMLGEGLLAILEKGTFFSHLELVGLRAFFYLIFAVVGVVTLLVVLPMAHLLYRMYNGGDKSYLQLHDTGIIEFMSPMEYTKDVFTVDSLEEAVFVETDNRYTVEFKSKGRNALTNAVIGDVVLKVYLVKDAYFDLKVALAEHRVSSVEVIDKTVVSAV